MRAEILLQIHILGPVRASVAGVEVGLGPPKQRAVLAMLALHAGQRVPLDGLIGALWDGQPPAHAANLVHTYVARLRQALEPDMPRRHRTNVIGSAHGGYRLIVPDDRLDLLLFRRLTKQAMVLRKSRGPGRAFGLLGRALREWQDPQLGDLMALLPRENDINLVRRELVGASLAYITLGLEHGRTEAVLPFAERLAQVEPLNEAVQARCLQALARTGQRAAAMERYTDLRTRLQVELGVDPNAELAAAYRELLLADAPAPAGPVQGGGTAMPGGGTPVRPPWRGPGPAVDGLVGRQDDVVRALNLVDRYRLVTLTGPAGVGKTALALAIAEIARDGFADGVAVVELSTARKRWEVVQATAAVLGVPRSDPDDRPDVLLDRCVDQRLLLVLDNVELAVDETAEMADEILRACPGIRMVVTSRELLGMAYEAVYSVRPLAVPDDTGGDHDTARLTEAPASRLFARRAAQVRPGFRLTESNADLVASICRRLDGLPLAIELAAASLRTGQLGELVDRLDDPLHTLRPPRRGGPSHHGSLRAAVHRSVELLDPTEQRCFASLGAVPDGFCVEAATLAGGALSGERWNVPALLDRLVDKSVLEVHDGAGGRRYRMLGTVRALAREMLRGFGYPDRQLTPQPCAGGCGCLS